MSSEKPTNSEMDEIERVYLSKMSGYMDRAEFMTRILKKHKEFPYFIGYATCARVVAKGYINKVKNKPDDLICPFRQNLLTGTAGICLQNRCALYNAEKESCALLLISRISEVGTVEL